ncbi:MAG: fimbrillin family protein [Muribaculaceae bacterium]|nr:fimbrillin family protein [Muribaculaceae bacterium]
MDKKKIIYFALGALLILPSCSQDEPEVTITAEDNRIYFRSYLPTVTTSRASVLTSDKFAACQVTCFNPEEEKYIDNTTGALSPYFGDVTFIKDVSDKFHSQSDEELIWPGADSELHFFAYYPSVEDMKKTSTGNDCFRLVNRSAVTDGSARFDYRLENFSVAREIADQIDFVTAYASGSQLSSSSTGVKLDFKHRLARVELSAWGDNEKYDFEIAGVRIGNPLTQADFDLSAATRDNDPQWLSASQSVSTVEHIFSSGETIVRLGNTAENHRSEDNAASLMGTAGPAMVIPMQNRIEAWEGKADPAITNVPYATDKLYFSILLRVKNADKELVYPYPNRDEKMNVIYFAVDSEGQIVKRLYEKDDRYYTSPDCDEGSRYVAETSVEICPFGWAALPVAARWEAGKIYTYKLNYSNGIGWHDPDDPEPGEPIIERGKIPFNVVVSDWIRTDEDKSDINVPKR